MRTIKKIPHFKNEDTEREFWASHDVTDYFDVRQAKRVRFPHLQPSVRSISLRLPESLVGALKVVAHKQDVPYQSLMKIYLSERVEKELQRR